MAILRAFTVLCDSPMGGDRVHAPGCARSVVYTTDGSGAARQQARSLYGWVRRAGLDLSPECAAVYEERGVRR